MINADLPPILIKGQSESAGQKLSNALGVVLAATSHAASLMQLVDEDLLRHLHRKLHGSYGAERREGSYLGRLRNRLTGDDPNYVEMSGAHLYQTLQLIGTDAAGRLNSGQTYLLRKDMARQAHDVLGAQLGVDPETLKRGLT